MNDLERAHYARHLAAFENNEPDDVMHWKYIDKYRGPSGKWVYKYKEEGKANKLTGKTDHEYGMIKDTDWSKVVSKDQNHIPDYEMCDNTNCLSFKYTISADKENRFAFEFWDGYEDPNATYTVKTELIAGQARDVHTYTYTRDGQQYETTVQVSPKNNYPYGIRTKNLTSDTFIEKARDKVKSFFNKKQSGGGSR